MRHSAVEFARVLGSKFYDDNFDAVFCTDFLNLAEFKGLAPKRLTDLPTVIYFHENQFAYPNRQHDSRDLHFGYTNFTSCLAADQIWFNSNFNRQSLIQGFEQACRHWPDYAPTGFASLIIQKSSVQPPGIELPPAELPPAELIEQRPIRACVPVHLIWAARWEHDKNPELLLYAIEVLDQRDFDFQLSVIGQSFRNIPIEFEQIHRKYGDRVVSWGYQKSRGEYWQALARADIYISTADHEFFGIAAAEAIAAGLYPILPNRLAYPELINAEEFSDRTGNYLFDGGAGELADCIIDVATRLRSPDSVSSLRELRNEIVQRHNWIRRASELDELLATVDRQGESAMKIDACVSTNPN